MAAHGVGILGPRMGVAVAYGEQSIGKSPGVAAASASPAGSPLPALRLERLLLLDSAGNYPVTIEAITFADDGIGVTRSPGGQPRVLPWSSVSAHVVEHWPGGIVPEKWVEPQYNGAGPAQQHAAQPAVSTTAATAPRSPGRPSGPARPGRALPYAEPGAVIAIRTPFGTYRFLHRGGDANDLSRRITDFAVRHQGLVGVPSVTTVARPRSGSDRRQGTRSAPTTSPWRRAKPYLVVALIVFIGTAVTLILLQSAGTIHLPYLGGSSPGTIPPFRTP